MTQQVGIQVRLWPWSADERYQAEITRISPNNTLSLDYYGSPVLELSENVHCMLPKRHEQFIAHGPSYRTLRGNYRLYEMPHGVLASQKKTHKQADSQHIIVSSYDNSHNVTLETTFATPHLTGEEPSELALIIMAWNQAFDDWIDVSKKENFENQQPWKNIRNYLKLISGDSHEPRMALIVQLAEQMSKKLEPTVRMARKILLRERSLLPVERITETDTACLRWYVRQPGETMAQKATAHRQSLMGIARKESFNTLENRVLKDFLLRCKGVAQRYLTVEVGNLFQQSTRGKLVRQFQNLCAGLIEDSNLRDVAPLRSRVRPNYVLQSDMRYRDVWRSYQRLLRQDDEEDRSWDWQPRTWADISRLLIGAALSSMEDKQNPFAKPLLQASMYIYKEQRLGSRVLPGTEPGPFMIFPVKGVKTPEWVLELIHSEEAHAHDATKELGRMGAHLYLVLERIGKLERRVIALWAAHTASSTHEIAWNDISLSAQHSLMHYQHTLSDYQTNFPKLFGLVVASSLQGRNVASHKTENGAYVFEVPADPTRWDAGLETLATKLQKVIEETIR